MAAGNSAFMENLRQLFAECDTDQNGSLGRAEFHELCGKIGLNQSAAAETFERLDVDRDDKITFEEFAAGFAQYSKQASPAAPAATSRGPSPAATSNQQQHHTPDVPPRFLAHPSAAGGSTSPKTAHRTANWSPSTSPGTTTTTTNTATTTSRLSPSPKKAASPIGVLSLGSTGSSSASTSSAGSSSQLTSSRSASSGLHSSHLLGSGTSGPTSGAMVASGGDPNNVIVYDNSCDYSYDGSGQFGSLVSAGGNSLSSFTQVKTMQDLLECVQKLQNENQILSQIFFKDKREREEYISQLGEEFDQQLREVEERANRRAREELEQEKKRLSEMMQTERETLQHHYQTLEKMSKLVRSPNGKLDDGETIDKVKSKLEDTFMENRQLKRSLLDTKSDVAMIWKEMEKLKKQYEDKLSSAYEKHSETKSECEHIKQQLNLMKDSNRKLQDASDVIANYITDKVEPVIKVATSNYDGDGSGGGGPSGGSEGNFLSPNRGLSPSSSRRGSILSEYLNAAADDEDEDDGSHRRLPYKSNAASSAGDLESMASSQLADATSKLTDAEQQLKQSASENNLTNRETKQSQEDIATIATTTTTTQANKSTNNSLKGLGRHFLLGGRAQSSDTKPKETTTTTTAKTTTGGEQALAPIVKSASADEATKDDEPSVEPSDGPSKATFNIILVGDSFVGKSSFAARFMEGSFVQGLISNCSIDFKTKSYKVNGINYTVNLWDTAGQERFRSITASYFRKADGIILMYDITDKRSYLNVRNWMSTIADTAAENVAVLLVGNKIDLRQANNKSKCVPTVEGFKLAKEYDIMFLETSVKTGTNLLPSMGRLIRLIAKNNTNEEEDKDRIKLNDKDKRFACMPKNC